MNPPSLRTVRADVLAGLTTAIMLVPQAMAYALLAGLPPVVGLYASIVPLVAYALAGTSTKLAVGPVAMDSILTASTVGALAVSGTDRYLELATLLALLVGVMQVLLGAVKAGAIVRLLERPVVSGFTSAAALVIASSQLASMVGLSRGSGSIFTQIEHLFSSGWHLPTLALGLATAILLVMLKRHRRRWPRALIVVAFGSLACAFFLHPTGVAVVGEVPAGLPSFALELPSMSDIMALAGGALAITLVAFMEGISVATKVRTEQDPPLNANRELVGLGLANLAAGLFGGYPVAGGLSRTAVAADAGATSKLAGVSTAVFVAIALLWLTPLLFYVPKAVLAAIIITAVLGLVDVHTPRQLWREDRAGFLILVATFATTLLVGIQQGMGLAWLRGRSGRSVRLIRERLRPSSS